MGVCAKERVCGMYVVYDRARECVCVFKWVLQEECVCVRVGLSGF